MGDAIGPSLENAIKQDTDYILLFIDAQAVASKWVQQEVVWTLEQEHKLDRIILLPVVVDSSAWLSLKPDAIRDRKYLKLDDYTEVSVRSLSKKITSELFSLICRDINSLRKPSHVAKASVIDKTDQVLNDIADLIRRLTFDHRESKPIEVQELCRLLQQQPGFEYDLNGFDTLMRKIIQNDLIPGLVYDGFELYLKEEHYKWKGRISSVAKRRIAKAAASMIRSGCKVALDAGSSLDEVARILCTRFENKSLFNLTIITTSMSVANIFLETGTRLGYDDDNSAFKLYIAGGRVRPNTLAVIDDQHDSEASYLRSLLTGIGGVDVAIVGVNGITWDRGFTTHENSETWNKKALLSSARKKLILGDSSKIGIVEQECFSTFDDDILLITDDSRSDAQYVELVTQAGAKIQIAKRIQFTPSASILR